MTSQMDALVVGGGIVGCAAAYYLARAGLDKVLLVDLSPWDVRRTPGPSTVWWRRQGMSE